MPATPEFLRKDRRSMLFFDSILNIASEAENMEEVVKICDNTLPYQSRQKA